MVTRHLRRVVTSTILAASLFGFAGSGAAAPPPTRAMNILFTEYTPAPSNGYLVGHTSDVADLAVSLKANTVILDFPIFTSGYSSSSVYAGVDPSNPMARTPTTSDVAAVVQILQSRGLSVSMRPLLDEEIMRPSHWRGTIQPQNRAQWFKSYRATIKPYLQLSQQLGASGFTIQTELHSLNSDPHWNSLISWASTIYSSGPLIWNPTMQTYFPGMITHRGTSLSVDLYPSINLPDTATVGQLVAAWNHWWSSIASPALPSNTTIGEVHIGAQDGLYPMSYAWSGSGAFDQAIQANWFSAACQFSRQHHFAGIAFWNLALLNPLPSLTTPNPARPGDLQPMSFAAIKSCFAG